MTISLLRVYSLAPREISQRQPKRWWDWPPAQSQGSPEAHLRNGTPFRSLIPNGLSFRVVRYTNAPCRTLRLFPTFKSTIVEGYPIRYCPSITIFSWQSHWRKRSRNCHCRNNWAPPRQQRFGGEAIRPQGRLAESPRSNIACRTCTAFTSIPRSTLPDMRKKKTRNPVPAPPEEYVVGCRKEGFCWLLPQIGGERADDRNVDAAQKFTSLAAAIEASNEYAGNVFELAVANDKYVLHEIKVEPAEIERMPYDGCYELLDALIAGPSFVCNHWRLSQERILRLSAAGIDCIVSLVSKAELFWQRGQLDRLWFDDLFRQHYFPLVDHGVPSVETTTLILNTLDKAIEQGQQTFLHCVAGRGRTGTIAGCFAARHGVATGEGALNFLAKRRYQYGLFQASPETERQREFVRSWRRGQ